MASDEGSAFPIFAISGLQRLNPLTGAADLDVGPVGTSSPLINSLLDFALSAAAASCSSSRAQRPYRAASAVST
ncbi:MAG: hypothetical protein ACI80N_002965, partial [Gammaproteobacteria bacterium]